jgi:hypothetical protein
MRSETEIPAALSVPVLNLYLTSHKTPFQLLNMQREFPAGCNEDLAASKISGRIRWRENAD